MHQGREFEKEVRPVEVRRHCAAKKCPGEMIATGDGMDTSFNMMWAHKCTVCDEQQQFAKKYPSLEYRPAK